MTFSVEIPYQNPEMLFAPFADQAWSILLHSAQQDERLGRYSYIGINPFSVFEGTFSDLKKALAGYSFESSPNLPPFQGGVMGYWGYELLHQLEDVTSNQIDDMQLPSMALGFYDTIISFDHQLKKAWVISMKSQQHAEVLQKKLLTSSPKNANKQKNKALNILSNFTQSEYQAAVRKIIDYIYAGDVFEVNLSQRFESEFNGDYYGLYKRLNSINPAPFSAFFNFGEGFLISSSPERFLQLHGRHVETRPIKGTRPRVDDVRQDEEQANALLHSEKDRSENIMIVDLLRNDLSKVCLPNSVKVAGLCELESYATVHHLVSTICGELRPGLSALDLLQASFPGGSITGAPKVRAMEIIAELEPHKRGPYCGNIGYIGFSGDMDLAITIRTYVAKGNQLTFHAGGAIVADSDPQQEYVETLNKAKALQEALH